MRKILLHHLNPSNAAPIILLLFLMTIVTAVGAETTVDPESHDYTSNFRGGAVPDSDSLESYWTPERMQNAKPMPLPASNFDESIELGTYELPDSDIFEESYLYKTGDMTLSGSDASVFQLESQAEDDPFFKDFEAGEAESSTAESESGATESGAVEAGEAEAGEDYPMMVSPKGYPFTTRRISPDTTINSSPFFRAGKLYFTKPDGNYVCSAAVINRRILLTAAHCVFDRQTKKFYTNWLYVPAYNGAISATSPYCQWSSNYRIVASQWSSSSGYPTTDDFAILVLNDRVCNSYTRTIGAWLGYFGWQTYRLIGNNISQLGYPGNLDSGRRMQITQSNVYSRTSYAGEIGSAQGPGTSGGPWVQNFGVVPSGMVAIGGSGYTGSNRVVGVSSYGSVNHNQWQYGGSSVLNNNFVRILNTACGKAAGNCN